MRRRIRKWFAWTPRKCKFVKLRKAVRRRVPSLYFTEQEMIQTMVDLTPKGERLLIGIQKLETMKQVSINLTPSLCEAFGLDDPSNPAVSLAAKVVGSKHSIRVVADRLVLGMWQRFDKESAI